MTGTRIIIQSMGHCPCCEANDKAPKSSLIQEGNHWQPSAEHLLNAVNRSPACRDPSVSQGVTSQAARKKQFLDDIKEALKIVRHWSCVLKVEVGKVRVCACMLFAFLVV